MLHGRSRMGFHLLRQEDKGKVLGRPAQGPRDKHGHMSEGRTGLQLFLESDLSHGWFYHSSLSC